MPSIDFDEVLPRLREHRDALTAAIKDLERLQSIESTTQRDAANQLSGVTRTDAAFDLLCEVDEPLRPKQIYEMLEARGFRSNARKPIDSMRAALRSDSRFEKNEDGAWELSGEGLFLRDVDDI